MNTQLPEFFLKRVAEMDAECAQKWKDFLVSFVKNLNPEATLSVFPLELGPRVGSWEVTLKRTAWGSEEDRDAAPVKL
jgi:hypothetical protein